MLKMLQLPRYYSYMRVTETYSQSSKDSENRTDLYLPEKKYFRKYSNFSEHDITKGSPKKSITRFNYIKSSNVCNVKIFIKLNDK